MQGISGPTESGILACETDPIISGTEKIGKIKVSMPVPGARHNTTSAFH